MHLAPSRHSTFLQGFSKRAESEAPPSDDDFSMDDGEDEQESVMKQVKFPEIEGPHKIAGAAPKVAKCLEKRAKALSDLGAKYLKGSNLTDLQRVFLSR